MSLLHRFLATGSPAPQTYVDDVFSAYTYTGNGSTQTITNGIDLSGQGGLVWTKNRTLAGSTNHILTDSVSGLDYFLRSNQTNAATSYSANSLTAPVFNSNGFTTSNYSDAGAQNGYGFISWTFRKAPKFFDVVTYTGNATNRTIAHSLGSVPGMIIVKRTDTTADWQVYSNSIANTEYLVLNSTAAKATGTTRWNSTTPTASVFSLGTDTTVNASGGTYVAYLFAHDTATDGLIQCGSFTETGSTVSVNLGWEPQYLLVKRSNGAGNWWVFDTMRGWVNTTGANSQYLCPNLSQSEIGVSNWLSPTATGFNAQVYDGASAVWTYVAIRRPNKPPTLGTQVYNAIARTGTGAAATVTGVGFAPDIKISGDRNQAAGRSEGEAFNDRLRGATSVLLSTGTFAESTDAFGVTSFTMDGVVFNSTGFGNWSGDTYINWFFKRAPGVCDEICFTGTGSNTTQAHNLAAAPELWLVKSRSGATQWVWGSSLLAATEKIVMPSVNGRVTDATVWNSTYPTSTVLSLGTSTDVNNSAVTYVGYLWASTVGVSKVFTYTGNGSSQTINCGFTTGARFIMIIRATASTSQDIYIWDSTRGIVAGNDPHLSLNTTAAEVTTDDSVDADTTGFIVNQLAATNVNVTGAVYIGLAYA